jgi:hypothetical protein
METIAARTTSSILFEMVLLIEPVHPSSLLGALRHPPAHDTDGVKAPVNLLPAGKLLKGNAWPGD